MPFNLCTEQTLLQLARLAKFIYEWVNVKNICEWSLKVQQTAFTPHTTNPPHYSHSLPLAHPPRHPALHTNPPGPHPSSQNDTHYEIIEIIGVDIADYQLLYIPIFEMALSAN